METKARHILSALFFTIFWITGHAAGISLQDFTIMAGQSETSEVVVENNDYSLSGIQFDIELPEYLTIESVIPVAPYENLSVRFQRLENNHYRVIAFSNASLQISEPGPVLKMTFSCSLDAEIGQASIEIKKALFSTIDGRDVVLSDKSAVATIIPLEIKVAEIKLNTSEAEMHVTETMTLLPTVLPENATNKALQWTTNAPSIASVSPDGVVTALMIGEANITARATDGSNVATSCKVTVKPIALKGVSVSAKTTTSLRDGETVQLAATIAPSNATEPITVKWSTNKPEVATVDETNGLVTAHATLGTATITATATNPYGDEVSGTIDIKVIATDASRVILSKYNTTLLTGQSYKLTATIEPESTTDKTVTWSSDKSNIAKVGEDGTVTAVSAGTANITATCGDVTATCVVTVKTLTSDDVTVTPGSGTTEGDDDSSNADNTSEGGSLSGNDLTLRVGQTSAISLLVKTDSDVAPTFEWTLADGGSEVVTMTVNADDTKTATFKGLAIGKTTYTVKRTNTSDAIVTGNITVIAENPITSLTIEPIEIKIAKNAQPVQLTATVTPDDATEATLKWTSSDESIATVDEDGLVTPVSVGECEITAATIDGSNLSATCKVTVIEITGFEFNLADGNTGDDSDVITADGIVLDLHQTVELKVTVEPDVDVAPELTWRIADSSIASLVNGEDCYTAKITGEKIGETTLTVSLTEDPSVSVTTKVIVLDKSGLGNLIFNDANGAPVDVYNMQGVCIVRNATLDDLKALSPGFYIIGGKKVLIK
ncbi:MAG: Ig domain-containing protein [Muribaculaceae bacterium]|nr:Ig domain-containing protein [Muribaculaceae bacterium]